MRYILFRILLRMRKYTFIHLLCIILLFTQLYFVSICIFGSEPCIEMENKFMKSYKMIKNHFMNSNNITNDVYNKYKDIESSIEKKEDVTEDNMALYNNVKLKLEQSSTLNTLFYCIIPKSNFLHVHINDSIPYHSHKFRSSILQEFK